MEREVKGRLVNGKVELLESVDWEDGEEVKVVRMNHAKEERDRGSLMSTAGAWKDDSEYWGEFLREWYIKRGRINK